jgi:hypothetical protein
MTKTIQTIAAGITDFQVDAYDLARGIATYTANPLLAGLARVIAKHPGADIGNAFNPKQVACKLWAREKLFDSFGADFGRIAILGGWYGVLAAMLFDDPRFVIENIDSFDIDADVGTVAETLNRDWSDRFCARTDDMYALDYQTLAADLVVNTSCEHIADLPAWLALLPKGSRVLLQSNDYFAEPTHINCVPSLEAFVAQAGLSEVVFSGALAQKKYTRFMLIGTV